MWHSHIFEPKTALGGEKPLSVAAALPFIST